MKYHIIGKNIEVTDAIRNKIIKKLSDFDKYLIISEDQECRVVVSVAPNSQKIEVTIPTKVALLRSEVKHDDLYAFTYRGDCRFTWSCRRLLRYKKYGVDGRYFRRKRLLARHTFKL